VIGKIPSLGLSKSSARSHPSRPSHHQYTVREGIGPFRPLVRSSGGFLEDDPGVRGQPHRVHGRNDGLAGCDPSGPSIVWISGDIETGWAAGACSLERTIVGEGLDTGDTGENAVALAGVGWLKFPSYFCYPRDQLVRVKS
jgi:hypothetical protein